MRNLVPAAIVLIVTSAMISAASPLVLAQSARMKTDAILAGDQTLSKAMSMQRQLDSASSAASAASSSVRLKLTPRQTAIINHIGQQLAARPDAASVMPKWQDLVTSARLTENDVNALVQSVLREAYRQQQLDLRRYLERLKGNRTMMAKLSRERQATRDHMVALGANRTAAFRPDPRFGRREALTSAAELRAYDVELDAKLRQLTKDDQLADVDLQNILQKQQQTLQMMSNISKMLYDTAMAVIRKLGG